MIIIKANKPFRELLDKKARAVYDAHPENLQLLYSSSKCQLCGLVLPMNQNNKVITEGKPPLCKKCLPEMMEKMETLQHLFGQLRLL